jgi:hypothetical protein
VACSVGTLADTPPGNTVRVARQCVGTSLHGTQEWVRHFLGRSAGQTGLATSADSNLVSSSLSASWFSPLRSVQPWHRRGGWLLCMELGPLIFLFSRESENYLTALASSPLPRYAPARSSNRWSHCPKWGQRSRNLGNPIPEAVMEPSIVLLYSGTASLIQ